MRGELNPKRLRRLFSVTLLRSSLKYIGIPSSSRRKFPRKFLALRKEYEKGEPKRRCFFVCGYIGLPSFARRILLVVVLTNGV